MEKKSLKIKSKITHQYTLPFCVHGCLALSNDMCVILGTNSGELSKFVVLNSGTVDVLDYEVPSMEEGGFNYRGALFKTEVGFGCVFDYELVEYDLRKRTFKITSIKDSLPRDEAKRKTGPYRAAVKVNKKEYLVTLQDHFHYFKTKYFCTLKKNMLGARYEPFIYKMQRATFSSTVDCHATYTNGRLLFHRCEYGKMLADRDNDISEFCEISNGRENVIATVTKGIGRFSSDGEHLLIRTYTKPYVFEFYSLKGRKLFTVPMTPKRVIGNIEKQFLEFFDKYDSTLWMGRNYNVTQTRFETFNSIDS
ncbi:hypothetical protein AB6T38_05260 [Aliiglaciecola sp. SL4]|uniref:hypothetical protein n=1 Tax=Aliiglaciecola sp. SL4 TaxID=3239806 RepID=UPI00355B879B